MTKRNNPELDILEKFLHDSHMQMIELAKSQLRKLTVKELRVLAKHYKIYGYDELRKPELLDEIAGPYVDDQF